MKPINDKVFWDTNVLVYCYDKNQSERKIKAQTLSSELPDIIISTQVMNELAFVLSKKQGLDWDTLTSVLQEVSQNFTICRNNSKSNQHSQKISFLFLRQPYYCRRTRMWLQNSLFRRYAPQPAY